MAGLWFGGSDVWGQIVLNKFVTVVARLWLGGSDIRGQSVLKKIVTVCDTVVAWWVRYKGPDCSKQIRDCVWHGCGLVG